MRILRRPLSSISISIRVLPASIAFSSNSFTTEEGRSMTSPAAIWFVSNGLNSLMVPIHYSPFSICCHLYRMFIASIGVMLIKFNPLSSRTHSGIVSASSSKSDTCSTKVLFSLAAPLASK